MGNKDIETEVRRVQKDICDLIKNINDLNTLEYYRTFIALSKDVWQVDK